MSLRNRCPVVLVTAALAAFTTTPAEAAAEPETTRVSVSSTGIQSAGGNLVDSTVSANGGFVAFSSSAADLVPSDANTKRDIFVRELRTGVTTRVTVDSAGGEANGDSSTPSISADGRFVAFDSEAENLVSDDTNAKSDVFVHDRQTGQTTRVSVTSLGQQAMTGGSNDPSISADGRIIAFLSNASDLITGDMNNWDDVFVHDRFTGETTRVSVGPGGIEANAAGTQTPFMSGNGRFVAFVSNATNLIAGGLNGKYHVFVHDRLSGETRLVDTVVGGDQADGDGFHPSLNADGTAVAYESAATNLIPGDTKGKKDIFVTRGSHTTRVNLGPQRVEGDMDSDSPRISADGLSVVFMSAATNLVPNDTNGVIDVFVARGGKVVRTNLGPAADEADMQSFIASISADGRIVAFTSAAENLVDDDTNTATDAFVSVLKPTHGAGLQLFPS